MRQGGYRFMFLAVAARTKYIRHCCAASRTSEVKRHRPRAKKIVPSEDSADKGTGPGRIESWGHTAALATFGCMPQLWQALLRSLMGGN